MSTILVTGGAGFIGSHTCVELLNSGYDVVVLDNLSNSSEESLRRVQKITGKSLKFYEGDIADKELVGKILDENKIFAVIHFAGLKAVGESVAKPLEYYRNNISGTLDTVTRLQYLLLKISHFQQQIHTEEQNLCRKKSLEISMSLIKNGTFFY